MANFLYGSICLDAVPKELFKKVNGHVYLNIKVVERKEPSKYGHTHFISCEPKQDERKEGVNYLIGDMTEYKPKAAPTQEEIAAAPQADDNDLPF